MIHSLSRRKCLVSSCLVGMCTRYDGKSKPDHHCLEQLKSRQWLPVCPEQLGALPTPRVASDIIGGDGIAVLSGNARVIDKTGNDISKEFIRGARQVLAIARAQQIELAFLKSRSPSCGINAITGVTAALLIAENITCVEFGA